MGLLLLEGSDNNDVDEEVGGGGGVNDFCREMIREDDVTDVDDGSLKLSLGEDVF
jgi:hypothetical protein